MPTKLYVGNISPSVSLTELRELFEKYGQVLECDIIKDYAFVHMEDASKAKASIAALNEFNLKGNRIKVEMSVTQHRNSSRSSRREELSHYHRSSSTSIRSSRNRGYPTISSSRNISGPDRSHPRMRHSYMNSRSRPYDIPYERQRIPPPILSSINYGGMRGETIDLYSRNDFYHQRAPPISAVDHYRRGPSIRSTDDAYSAYPPGLSAMGPPRSRYAASPPSSRSGPGRYELPSRSSSSHRISRQSPYLSSSANSSRTRR